MLGSRRGRTGWRDGLAALVHRRTILEGPLGGDRLARRGAVRGHRGVNRIGCAKVAVGDATQKKTKSRLPRSMFPTLNAAATGAAGAASALSSCGGGAGCRIPPSCRRGRRRTARARNRPRPYAGYPRHPWCAQALGMRKVWPRLNEVGVLDLVLVGLVDLAATAERRRRAAWRSSTGCRPSPRCTRGPPQDTGLSAARSRSCRPPPWEKFGLGCFGIRHRSLQLRWGGGYRRPKSPPSKGHSDVINTEPSLSRLRSFFDGPEHARCVCAECISLAAQGAGQPARITFRRACARPGCP